MKIYKCILIFLMVVLSTSDVFSSIILPGLVGDNMVLQRSMRIPVWGWAAQGEQVQIGFRGRIYHVVAAENGKWTASLDSESAGGPYDMEIKGASDDIHIKNILVGDVWLCSGQSNMVFDFNNSRAKALYARDIASSTNDKIRQVLVTRGYASQSAVNCKTTGWQMASPRTLNSFSAVAYFYARNLYEKYHVAIGLINASYGGTIAEAWTSEEGLNDLSRYHNDISFLKDTTALRTRIVNDRKMVADWDTKLRLTDKGYDSAGSACWTGIGLDDSQWNRMPQPGFWDNNGFPGNSGSFWFRKEVIVPETASGRDAELMLGQVDDADITYFNGEIIGRTSNRDIVRKYKVPAALLKPGKNVITVRVTNYNGTGGLFPSDSLYLKTGNVNISLSGQWRFNQGAKMENRPNFYDPKNLPTSLYNAMIAPLIPYGLKGILWYQGEYNVHQAYAYRVLFQALIKDWRNKWRKEDLPFVFVQLPNFQSVYDHPIESEWAELREAQSMALAQPNTAMAVTIDLGEAGDIHPVDKKDVGFRLSLAARKLVYGEHSLVASGPVYKSMQIEPGKIVLTFDTNGSPMMVKDGDNLNFFAIAGGDRKFVWAKTMIVGNNIEVYNPMIDHPVAVRYGWAGNPAGCNLYNTAGLPASPFRTDNWLGMTVSN